MNVVIAEKGVIIVTAKEAAIVRMLADGLRASKIAEELELSVRTIETNMSTLRLKMGCSTLPHLVAFFFRNKLID